MLPPAWRSFADKSIAFVQRQADTIITLFHTLSELLIRDEEARAL